MKEIVLPNTGDFVRIERMKFSDVMACLNAPQLTVALIARLASIDGKAVDEPYLDAMPLGDAFCIANLINKELEPIGFAKGVA